MRSSKSKQQTVHLRLTFTSMINQYHMLIYRKLSTHILSHPRHLPVLKVFGTSLKCFMSLRYSVPQLELQLEAAPLKTPWGVESLDFVASWTS